MKIICLGDSLTAGCGLRRGENWVELLREQTGDEWINAGVCGHSRPIADGGAAAAAG